MPPPSYGCDPRASVTAGPGDIAAPVSPDQHGCGLIIFVPANPNATGCSGYFADDPPALVTTPRLARFACGLPCDLRSLIAAAEVFENPLLDI